MQDKRFLELRQSVSDISSHTKQVLGSKLTAATQSGDLKVPKEELSKLVTIVQALVDEAYQQAVTGFDQKLSSVEKSYNASTQGPPKKEQG